MLFGAASSRRWAGVGPAAALALALAACASAGGPGIRIEGVVELGPFCPVQQAGQPCPTPPGAFSGAEAVATNGTDEVRSPLATSGAFQLDLPAGAWSVTSTAGMSCERVQVSASGRVMVACDTGIR